MKVSAKRAKRRGDELRMKGRARRIMRLWLRGRFQPLDPCKVGVNASTHCRPCGCWMCQEPRREIPQPRERAFDYHELSCVCGRALRLANSEQAADWLSGGPVPDCRGSVGRRIRRRIDEVELVAATKLTGGFEAGACCSGSG
jgi:hypothetical protein